MNLSHRTLCSSPNPTDGTRCRLPFSTNDSLALVSNNYLQIYTLDDNNLQLVWEKQFWGEIFGVFRHKLPQNEYDSLIVGVDYSKIVVLNVENGCDLVETEFHQFEDDKITPDKPTRVRNPSIMRIDPTGSCIGLVLAQQSLFLLELYNERNIIKSDLKPNESHSNWEVITSYTLIDLTHIHRHLPKFEIRMYRIRDMVFLHGYNIPTLAIMHEMIPTCSLTLPLRQSNVRVSIASPPLKSNSMNRIAVWNSLDMPHNSFGLLAIETPFSGLIVLSKNALIYISHDTSVALELNSVARLDNELHMPITNSSKVPLEITSKVACCLDRNHLLVTVDLHKLALVRLNHDMEKIESMNIETFDDKLYHTSVLIPFSSENDNKFKVFVGCNMNDSELCQITYDQVYEDFEIDTYQYSDKEIDMFRRIYGNDENQDNPIPKHNLVIKISNLKVNTLLCLRQIGNISSACIGVNKYDRKALSFCTATGFHKTGRLQFVSSGIPTEEIVRITSQEFIGITEIFSFPSLKAIVCSYGGDNPRTKLYTVEDKSVLVSFDEDVFIYDQRTIFAYEYAEKNCFIQATTSVVKVIYFTEYSEDYTSVEIPAGENGFIKSVSVSNKKGFLGILRGERLEEGISYTVSLYDHKSILSKKLNNPYYQQKFDVIKNDHFSKLLLCDNNLFFFINKVLYVFDINNKTDIRFDHFYFNIFPESFRYEGTALESGKFDFAQGNANIEGARYEIHNFNAFLTKLGDVYIFSIMFRNHPTIFYRYYPQFNSFSRLHLGKLSVIGNTEGNIIPFTLFDKEYAFLVGPRKPMFIMPENGFPRILSSKKYLAGTVTFAMHQDIFITSDLKSVTIHLFNDPMMENKFIIGGCIVERFEMGCTIHQVQYTNYQDVDYYVLRCSEPIPYDDTSNRYRIIEEDSLIKLPIPYNKAVPITPKRIIDDDDIKMLPIHYEEHYTMKIVLYHKIQKTYKVSDSIDYNNHEFINTFSIVETYENPRDISHPNKFIAVGTGFMGQDQEPPDGSLQTKESMQMHGFLYVYQVAEKDEDVYNLRFTKVCAKIYASPILSITDICGYIALFIGTHLQLIQIYSFKEDQEKVESILKKIREEKEGREDYYDNREKGETFKDYYDHTLKEVTFYVGRFTPSSLISIKNYLLYTDMLTGYDIIRWREYGRKLITLAKDSFSFNLASGSFVSYKDMLGGLVFDVNGNVRIFEIDGYAIPSEAIVNRSVFFIGGSALSSGHLPVSEGEQGIEGHLTWYATTNGKIGAFTPIPEDVRHRLCVVQAHYINSLPGLSHFEYRSGAFQTIKEQDLLSQSAKLVVDMDLLEDFAEASLSSKDMCIKPCFNNFSELSSILCRIHDNGLDVFE